MPKFYIGNYTRANLKLLEEIVEKIVILNYTKGDAKEAAKKIIRVFLVPENSLNNFKK